MQFATDNTITHFALKRFGLPMSEISSRVCCMKRHVLNTVFLYYPLLAGGGILEQRDPSVCQSVPWRSCLLGYRHAGCLQLSHRRPPEMCRLRTRPRTDVDRPRFLHPRWPDWRRHDRYASVELPSVGGISSRRRRGDILYSTIYWTTCNKRTC